MIPFPNDLNSTNPPGTSWIEFFIQGRSPELLEQAQRDRGDLGVFTASEMRRAAAAKLRWYENISDRYFAVVEYLLSACKLNCNPFKPYNKHAPNCPVEDLGL